MSDGRQRDPLAATKARRDPLGGAKAWLVTGPLGRGLAFAIDFALALRKALLDRRT